MCYIIQWHQYLHYCKYIKFASHWTYLGMRVNSGGFWDTGDVKVSLWWWCGVGWYVHQKYKHYCISLYLYKNCKNKFYNQSRIEDWCYEHVDYIEHINIYKLLCAVYKRHTLDLPKDTYWKLKKNKPRKDTLSKQYL